MDEDMGIDVGGGIIGLIILGLDIWAIVNVLGSSASTGAKVLWTIAILVLPVIGLIAWLIAGPRRKAVAV
ncbi:MAG: PLD nuclease N-terminal domain-containing protein [Defluviicoccus sp.]